MKKNNKFSLSKLTLSSLECDILSLLIQEDETMNQEELKKRTKSSISGICKAIKRLENKGILFTIKDVINFYGINPYRIDEIKCFIIGHEIGKNRPLILSGHAFYFEAELNGLPDKMIKKLEKDNAYLSYLPSNWRYASRCFLPDGVFKLIKTKSGSKLLAHFRTFGLDENSIEQINTEKFLRLKSELENKYMGLKVGNAEFIASCPWQEYAIQKDHIAVLGIASGIKHKDVKQIEQSYGYPEWEEKGYNAKEKITKIIKLREKEIEELEGAQLNKSKQNNQQDKNKSNSEINEK